MIVFLLGMLVMGRLLERIIVVGFRVGLWILLGGCLILCLLGIGGRALRKKGKR